MTPRIGHIERYVLVHALIGICIALTVISSVIFLIDFVEISRTVGTNVQDVAATTIVGLALLQSPSVILMLLPFSFLFGVLGAFVSLNRRNELIALRAAGVSAWRFTFPVTAAAAVIGVASVLLLNPVASAMNDRFAQLQTKLLQGSQGDAPKPIWIRQGAAHQQVIIRARRHEGPGIELRDVSFFIYDLDADGSLRFSRRIEARKARLKNARWELDDGEVAEAGRAGQTFAQATLPSTLRERTALERFSSPAAIPFWNLPGTIARTERAGFAATAFEVQFQQLLATPLMYASMAILGAAFSLRLLRLGGLAQLSGTGVALGFGFFFLNQLCTSLGRGEIIPAVVAAWTPPALGALTGLTLLCYTEDG